MQAEEAEGGFGYTLSVTLGELYDEGDSACPTLVELEAVERRLREQCHVAYKDIEFAVGQPCAAK